MFEGVGGARTLKVCTLTATPSQYYNTLMDVLFVKCGECHAKCSPGSFYKDATRPTGLSRRCKACERKRGTRRKKERLDGRAKIIRKAKSVPCADCRTEYPYYVMDFDHRAGTVKLFNLSQWRRVGVGNIVDEIDKCDVVCANCHRERTARRYEEADREMLVGVDPDDD